MNTFKPIYVQYAEEAVHARHNRDFQKLANAAGKLYNHFVHNPKDYINIEMPLAVGSVFASCLGFKELDEDIQEVRAENAIYCLAECVESKDDIVRNSSVAYLFLVFSIFRKYIQQKMMKLFGASELGISMCTNTYFALPEDVCTYIVNSNMNTDEEFNCVLSYLAQFVSETTVLYLDLIEERNIFTDQLEKIKRLNLYKDDLYLKTGKTIFSFIFEDVKSDIIQYINYNNKQ